MVGKYLSHRKEREIREVFVIYGVELIFFYQSQQARELKCDDTRGLERNLQPPTESLMSGTWARTLLPRSKSADLPSATNSFAVSTPKNFAGNLPFLQSNVADPGRRLNVEDGNTLGLEMLKQIPVVARDLDDLAVRFKVKTFDHHVAVTPRMLGGRFGDLLDYGTSSMVPRKLPTHKQVRFPKTPIEFCPGMTAERHMTAGQLDASARRRLKGKAQSLFNPSYLEFRHESDSLK